MNSELKRLSSAWMAAKQSEAIAVAHRREIEDRITEILDLPQNFDGSKTVTEGDIKITASGRVTRKIDAELLAEIAAEHGTTGYLHILFNWKPTVNMSAWKNADMGITDPLLEAITTKPGCPSYKITKEKEQWHI